MRPGRGAERDTELCLAPQIGRKSVRAADHENSVRDRLIPPAPKMPGKRRAVDAFSAFIERHQDRFFRDLRRNRRGFLVYAGRCVPRAAFRNFMNLEAAKAELAAQFAKSLRKAFGKFPLRALLEAADCNDDEGHERTLACARPILIGLRLKASSPPPGFASTTFPDCRIREPRV